MSQNWLQKGDVLTVPHAELTFIDPGDALVNSEQPVIVGGVIPGIAEISAAATTDEITVDTAGGVYDLLVTGRNQVPADSAVAFGDALYLDTTDGELNKDTAFVLFGYALGTVPGGVGNAATIPVKLARV